MHRNAPVDGHRLAEARRIMNSGLLRNIVSTFLAQSAGFAVNLACGILIARCLAPAGRGDWAAITSTIGVIATFSYFAAGYAIVYLRASRDFTRHELFRASFVISLIGTLICLGVASIASRRLSQGAEPSFTFALLAYGLGQLCANLGTFVSMIFLADKEFSRTNVIGLLPRIAVLAGYGLLLRLHQFTLVSVVVVNVAASAALLWLVLVWFRGAFAEPVSHWRTALKEMMHYGLKVWLGLLAQSVTLRADQVLMAALLPRSLLGLYAVSVTVAELVGFFAGAAGFVVGPMTAALEGPALGRMIGQSFRMTFALVCGASLALYLGGPLLIHVFYGADYDGAVVSFHWLVIAGIPMSLFSLSKDVLVSRGQAAINLGVQLFGAIVTVGCCSVLIKCYGLAGAGIASFAAYSVVAAAALVFVSRNAGIPLRDLLVPTKADITAVRMRLWKRARPATSAL